MTTRVTVENIGCERGLTCSYVSFQTIAGREERVGDALVATLKPGERMDFIVHDCQQLVVKERR